MKDVKVELSVSEVKIGEIKALLSEGYEYGGEEIWSDVVSIDLESGGRYYFDLRVASSNFAEDGIYDVFVELVITDHNDEEVVSSELLYEWDDVYEIDDWESKIHFVLEIVHLTCKGDFYG